MLDYLKRQEEAQEVFKIIEELEPKTEIEFLYQGLYRIYKKQNDLAIKIFLDGLLIFPQSVKLNYYCSQEYLKQSKYKEANQYLDNVLELNQEWSEAWMQKAKINKGMKQYSEAINNINLAINLDPSKNSLYVLKTNILMEQHRYEEVVALLNSRLEATNQKDDQLILYKKLADAYEEQGRNDQAIKVLKQCIDLHPNQTEIWNYLGYYQKKQQLWGEALESYIRSTNIDPTQKLGFYNQGDIHNRLNQESQALEAVNKSLQLDPNYLNSLKLKGQILQKLLQYQDALLQFEKYLAIEPKNIDILNLKGNLLRNLQRYEESIVCYDQIILIMPKDFAYYNKGLCYMDLKKYDESLKAFDESLKINPKDIQCYIRKAEIFKLQENYKEALESLEKGEKIDGKNTSLLYCKGHLFYHLVEYEKSIEIYDSIWKIDPSQQTSIYNVGVMYNNIGNYDKSIEYLDKSLAMKPNDCKSMLEKGKALKFKKQFEDAEKILRSLSILEPKNEDCLYQLAITLKQQTSKQSQAIQIFKQLLEINPNHQLALSEYGQLLYTENQYEKSIPILQKSIDLNPEGIFSLLYLGFSYYQLKQYDDALVWLKKVIVINPKHFDAHYWMGQALSKLGQYTQALQTFDLALTIEQKSVKCYQAKAEIFDSLQMNAQVLNEIEKAIQLDPNNSDLYITKGNVYYHLDNFSEALDCYMKAQSIKQQAQIFYSIALCYSSLKNPQQAIEYNTKALALDSSYIPSYCHRAKMRIKTEKEEALKDLRIAKDLIQNPPSYIMEPQLKDCQNTINLFLNIDSEMTTIQNNLNNKSHHQNQKIQEQIKIISQKKQKLIETHDNKHDSNSLEIQNIINEINHLKNVVVFHQQSIETHDSQIQSLNQENASVQKILDQSGIKELAIVKGDLEHLYKTDPNVYEYFKVFYWTLLNYFTAYRTLSTGLVQANYNHDTEEVIKEKMTIVGAKKTLEISKELLKSIPFIGTGVTLVDKLLETFFQLSKKIEFKKRVMIITSIIQKDNGKDILFDDINIIVAKGVLAICKQKQILIKKGKQKKRRIDKKVVENTIQTIDKVKGNLGSVQTDLYHGDIGMYALEDIVFLLSHFYEHGDAIAKSKKNLDEIMVEVVVVEQKKKGNNKECIVF